LLRPIDIVESAELGTGVVYPEAANLQRLDLWLADQAHGISLETRLSIIRQVAEAVHYAHGSAVAHRDLGPESIWIKQTKDDGEDHQGIKALVGNWHAAGHVSETTAHAAGVTSLLQARPTEG